jgi:CBS domain-containing protein
MAVTVRDIMAPTPITARPDTPVAEIARIMRDEDVGAVLISEGGENLLGLVTDRDLVVRSLAAGLDPDTPARAVCSEELWSVHPDLDVIQAAELMRKEAVRRLPVVQDGKPVGVVSLGDIAVLAAPESVLGGISGSMPNT